jgi:hypothetical protein
VSRGEIFSGFSIPLLLSHMGLDGFGIGKTVCLSTLIGEK